jgi:hypothetical protein
MTTEKPADAGFLLLAIPAVRIDHFFLILLIKSAHYEKL